MSCVSPHHGRRRWLARVGLLGVGLFVLACASSHTPPADPATVLQSLHDEHVQVAQRDSMHEESTAIAAEQILDSLRQIPVTGAARAQGLLVIRTIDTTDTPVANVEVALYDTVRDTVLHHVTVPKSGVAIFRDVVPAQSFSIRARKLGFTYTVTRVVQMPRNDTLFVDLVMDAVTRLGDVTVIARAQREKMTDDKELGKKPIENLSLADALGRYKHRMLSDPYYLIGDKYACPDDTIQAVWVNGTRWPMRGRDTMGDDTLFYPPPPPTASSRRSRSSGRSGAQGADSGFSLPKVRLAYYPLYEIFASDVAYVRYFDCWETEFPKYRNSIVILLKPGVEFPAKHYGEAQRKPTR